MTAIEDFLTVRAGRHEIMHAWFGFPVAETRVFLWALADMFLVLLLPLPLPLPLSQRRGG